MKLSPVKALGVMGEVKPFIRFSEAGSNGLVTANSGAKTAIRISAIDTKADTMATGDRRKA